MILTNQPKQNIELDQSAETKTPGANQDFGIKHIIRRARKVTCWHTMLIAFAMEASEWAILLCIFVFFCVLRGREAQKVGT